MTLHEAIITILGRNNGLTTSEIAKAINSENLYSRNDEKPLDARQISARIKQYSHFFIRDGRQIYLKK